MARYFARFYLHRQDGMEDMFEDTFNTENEIKLWATLHSYRDALTQIENRWTIMYVYDSVEEKDITSKFN